MRFFLNKSGFSLAEIIMFISLLALIGATIPITLNYIKQIDRKNDVVRLKDMEMLKGAIDEFYTDNNRYPTSSEICFDNPGSTAYVDSLGLNKGCICHICGKKILGVTVDQQKIFSLIGEIPCDPNSTGVLVNSDRDYMYNYDCGSTTTNPQWYRIYTKLAVDGNKEAMDSGCVSGCGPQYLFPGGPENLNKNYAQISNNYAVTSSNITPESGTLSCGNYNNLHCFDSNNSCLSCGNQSSCESGSVCRANSSHYIDNSCLNKCK